jgi:hypothetical protein
MSDYAHLSLITHHVSLRFARGQAYPPKCKLFSETCRKSSIKSISGNAKQNAYYCPKTADGKFSQNQPKEKWYRFLMGFQSTVPQNDHFSRPCKK